MTRSKVLKLTSLVSGVAFLPQAFAHPGHEHSPGLFAGLIHSVTAWGPVLALLLVLVVGAYCYLKDSADR